ncbi:MAG TPA: DUF6600 domain-containing protein [Bryobacteraceae bacterium]|nr:DUF6600 domain-containing protein [Bryobacteraceae bacterium]
MRKRLSILLILGAIAAMPAMSQDEDPPARVARLGFMDGTVSFQPAGIEDWAPAELNHPVTIGDHLWTEADGRAEMETDNAEMRIGGRTNFTFLNLTGPVTQIQITTGTLNVRLHTLAPEEGFEVDTPQLSFTLLRAGSYRIDVSEKGDQSIVTVRAGDGLINIGDKATRVPLGTQVVASGTDNPALDSHPAPPTDQFDAWCMDRDNREDAAVSARYVSRDIPGYADLDQYGTWQVIAPYGAVWFPANMPADWAPYRYGHWGWVDPWGWSWVDDAPWGYAPFHYGRWIIVNDAWGWVPGAIVIRPVYAPALVAFDDFPVGAVVADPVVAWVPLGFGEVYLPPFAVSADYMASFNLGISVGGGFTAYGGSGAYHGIDPGSAHYAHGDRAMTAMKHGDFARGGHVGRDYTHVPRGAMGRGRMGGRPGVGPSREARMGRAGAARGVPPRNVANRRAVTHRAAPGRGGAARAENRGGAARGGENRGRAARGAENRGGAARGGENRGGAARGGAARGGENRGGAARGGAARGGAPSRGGSRARGGAPSRGGSSARGGAPSRGGSSARGAAPGGARGAAPGGARGAAPGGARGAAPGGARGAAPGGGRPGGTPGGGMGGRPGGTPGGGRPGGAPGGGRAPSAPRPAAPARKGK